MEAIGETRSPNIMIWDLSR